MTEHLHTIINIFLALLGLTLPGYSLARMLRIQFPLAAAFPFSAFLICQTVIALTLAGRRLEFAVVAAVLGAITILSGIVVRRREALPAALPHLPPTADDDRLPGTTALVASVALVAAIALRSTLYPLGGPDTFTRWDALAREMLRLGTLSFYPPVTPADYSIFFVPDGFPPLVASVYWWLYAATGKMAPQLTAISVTLQSASLLALTGYAARNLYGDRAAAGALLALVASSLFSSSLLIGQESGFLALAVAGQLCFAAAAAQSNRPAAAAAAAAVCASLAGLSREYGPALALPGLLVLLSSRTTRRLAWQYTLLTALFTVPWYLRNWTVAGNPLYSHQLPGGFRINELFIAIIKYYEELFSPKLFTPPQWLDLAGVTVAALSLPLLCGAGYLLLHPRRMAPYLVSLVLVFALWYYSISQTCGGVLYSLRVLAPATVLLALAAGAAWQRWWSSWNAAMQRLALAIAIVCAGWGVLAALSFPEAPAKVFSAVTTRGSGVPAFCTDHAALASRLQSSGLQPAGVLTESAYLALLIRRETPFRPIIIWNPEVGFLLDRNLSGKEMRRRLLERGIRYVAVNNSSLENEFLARLPLYADDFSSWKQLFVIADRFALYELPPLAATNR